MKTKLWLFLLIILLLPHVNARAQWVEQNSGVTANLKDIYFVDSLTGWAVGNSSAVIRTSDGGNTWIKQQLPRGDLELNKIQMIDRTHGFLIGNIGRYSAFLSTTNSGESWEIKFEDDTLIFGDIEFFDKQRGWLARWRWYDAGEMLYTDDGGNSWEVKVRSDLDNTQPEPYLFSGISFADEDVGYAIAQRSSFDGGVPSDIFQTPDGGETWLYIDSLEGPTYDIKAINRDSAWVWGEIWSSYTTDGGNNWINSGIACIDMTFFRDTKIWSIADTSGFDPRLRVLESDDNGLTWEKIFTSDIPGSWIPAWSSITNYGENYLWICGTNGKIQKYSPITSLKNEASLQSALNSQIHIYPNPFNSSTEISFILPKNEHVTLTVYDVLGKKVVELANANFDAGKHTVLFDASQLTSGVYIYILRAGNFTQSKKMLLMK